MSSFMVELMDIVNILKRADNNTMVVCDELASKTESKSATILTAYLLERLTNLNSSTIIATHLHEICDMESVRNIKGLAIKHIKITYDEKKDILIYDRLLSDGTGPRFYGIMISKFLMKNDEFNTRTKELEDEFDDYKIKKSRYNKDVMMLQCEICGTKKGLESHHIEPQRACDKYKSIENPHIKKDALYNIAVLCSKCHDMHDRGDINILYWEETSEGRKLKYDTKVL
jgi:DNA mismatch repair protein MutS